ncbi:hypothetical protein NKR19_g5907 [Coniochaeta hoffmannii]|uniref:Uncharacterized protein n=1 Tax=Coniochaeta hoffmannii TaxID=91930 RepID=A0AA38VRT3_9PEZI|nr:hypothetical protein NKR19_g5907 [Coniochaeta hoffmannii]
MYVLARRRFIGARGNPRRIAATITDLVDQWISFLDNGCRRQPRQRGVKQHFAAQPLSPPSSDRPVQGRTPLSSCKRKGESLEQGEAKRTHIVFKDEPNDHEEHMDASRNWKQEDAGSDSHGSELIVDDDSKAMSWSPPSIRSRRSRRTTRWSVSVPSPPSPSSTRKEVAADLATVDVAPGTLSDLVQQQDSSRKTKYRKFKAQILDQEQRITALEQQAAERLAAITDLEAKHSKMLDGLSLEVNMMQTWPQSRTGATWEKELMDKVKTAMDEEGRALSHEFSVKMSQQKDSIEQLVGEHSQRQEKATSRLKGQLTQTGQSIEGILDRFQLNHHGDMAKLRSIVAAQASVIEEQGRLMAEMKEQISKLTEKQEDKSVKDDGVADVVRSKRASTHRLQQAGNSSRKQPTPAMTVRPASQPPSERPSGGSTPITALSPPVSRPLTPRSVTPTGTPPIDMEKPPVGISPSDPHPPPRRSYQPDPFEHRTRWSKSRPKKPKRKPESGYCCGLCDEPPAALASVGSWFTGMMTMIMAGMSMACCAAALR